MPSNSCDDGPDDGIVSDVGISAVGIGDADGIASGGGIASPDVDGIESIDGGDTGSDACIWLAAGNKSFGCGIVWINGWFESIYGRTIDIGVTNIDDFGVLGITVGTNFEIGGAGKFEYGVLSAGPAGGGE